MSKMSLSQEHIHNEKKSRKELIDEIVPQFEKFIESRENYIHTLENTIKVVIGDDSNDFQNRNNISSSIDELVAMQRLSNIIGTALEPNTIVNTLIDLTQQVIPLIEANIFLFDGTEKRLMPLTAHGSDGLEREAQQQLEAGIIDWIFSEKKTVVIPDLSKPMDDGASRNYVLVPLMLRGEGVGVYLILTEKKQEEFSHQDIQLLTVLANQAAVGVENWRAHKQLTKANDELKMFQVQMLQAAKLAALGELSASIVHEIKNPVQILVMQIEIVMRGKGQDDWLGTLNTQINRLSDITRRLMNFSRSVGEEYGNEVVDANKEVKFVLEILGHDFHNNNIHVQLNLAENLPTVQGSISHLQQVFLNLLINARDAMPKGGTITVASEVRDFKLYLHFADSGTGITSEDMAKLFTPFFTTKEIGKGTGLGLSICNKIITNHQGEIKVASEVDKGTTFTIILPIRRTLK